MKNKNEQIADTVATQIYSKLCDFYNEKMIHVPLHLRNTILNETIDILNKYYPNKYAVKSLESIATRVKAKSTLNILLQAGTDKHWTIKELASQSHIASSGIHKFKHRLLFLGVIEPSKITKGETRFHLTEKGIEQIKKIPYVTIY